MGQFNGDGFDASEFTDDERRRLRHMYRVLNDNFRQMDEGTFETLTKGAALVTAFQIMHSIIKVGAPIGAFGLAFGAFAKMQGWI